MLIRGRWMFLAALLVLSFTQVAHSELRAVGPVFPEDPADTKYNGFPLWYRDTTGVTLELPNPPAGDGVAAPTMIFDAVDPANPFSVQVGFGSEAFYYYATSSMNLAGGRRALLVMGVEAAFAGGAAADGDQIVFSRIRIRIDVPIVGTYTVFHPYGQRTFNVTAAGRRAINETIDVGVSPGVFTGALKGDIGPFLKADVLALGVDPAQWIGDGVTVSTVTGSPIGFNKFRIEGPAGSGIGGAGTDFIETDQFMVSGKIYSGTAFSIARSTYARDVSGTTVDVWARIPAPANPAVALSAQIAAEPTVPMTRTALRFFTHFPFNTPVFPAQVSVAGTTGGVNSTTLQANLVDVVKITLATYSLSTKDLIITATSSDLTGAPVLTASGWGSQLPMVAGSLTVNIPTPPPTVAVRSSQGGSETALVVIVP